MRRQAMRRCRLQVAVSAGGVRSRGQRRGNATSNLRAHSRSKRVQRVTGGLGVHWLTRQVQALFLLAATAFSRDRQPRHAELHCIHQQALSPHLAFVLPILLHNMAPGVKKPAGKTVQAEIALQQSLKNCLVNLPSSLVSVLVNANAVCSQASHI